MDEQISLDGRTLVGVANGEDGEVSGDTKFRFEQTGNRLSARYSGGPIVEGHLVGSLDGTQWDIRYVQINESGESASGHSIGEVSLLKDRRVRVEDTWEWESKPGAGKSVLEETRS